MRQHYTQSKASRNLNLHAIGRLSEDQAHQTLNEIRWAETSGQPVCPACGSFRIIKFRTRRTFRCKDCTKQFSVTSGTALAGHKLSAAQLLFVIARFVLNAKGCPAIEMAKTVGCNPTSALILLHKIREAMAFDTKTLILTGEVEIDGCYIGKYRKPANYKENRVDRRRPAPKQKCVGVARQRGGPLLVQVNQKETQFIPFVIDRVDHNATIHADEAAGWDRLSEVFLMERINHKECFSDGISCTNFAESFFSRLRRAEEGIHHHISGVYADLYVEELAWRENNSRISDAERFEKVLSSVMKAPVSRRFAGYFQRSQRS